MNKLLMHCCCAPCFVYVHDDITKNGLNSQNILEDISGFSNNNVEMTAIWSNQNIHPNFEYNRRRDTFINYCENQNQEYVVLDKYDFDNFIKKAVNDKDGFDTRCEYCYYNRLKEVFEYAKDNDFNMIATTLTISPYQNHEYILKIGKKLQKEYEKYNITFLHTDFSKHFREGQNKAIQLGLYRQKYCGCVFSMDQGKWVY